MVIVKKTMNEPRVAWITVKHKINANFWKNKISVNNMMIAEAIVVNAAAKMEGPILIKARLVRSSRLASPGNAAYAWLK